MLCLSPAERVSAIVEMNNPGIWVLGEVRKRVMAAGMGIVVEYANQTGKPRWQQPDSLTWDYLQFGAATPPMTPTPDIIEIPLVFQSKFAGHGAMDRWTINGKSFPNTETITLHRGQRYRLLFKNPSADDHPVHLHRHTFELRRISGHPEKHGILKDTVLVASQTEVDVEFTADNPGLNPVPLPSAGPHGHGIHDALPICLIDRLSTPRTVPSRIIGESLFCPPVSCSAAPTPCWHRVTMRSRSTALIPFRRRR
jgi:FtsP/CotA-like multicopper oxidase with cupredoxin domain